MITSDQTWRNTKLREWIGYYEDIVPKDKCESLIAVTKNSGQLKPSAYANNSGKIKDSDKGVIMDDNIWESCNSLRYGFDEEYDSPVFDDEDIAEEEETNQ